MYVREREREKMMNKENIGTKERIMLLNERVISLPAQVIITNHTIS